MFLSQTYKILFDPVEINAQLCKSSRSSDHQTNMNSQKLNLTSIFNEISLVTLPAPANQSFIPSFISFPPQDSIHRVLSLLQMCQQPGPSRSHDQKQPVCKVIQNIFCIRCATVGFANRFTERQQPRSNLEPWQLRHAIRRGKIKSYTDVRHFSMCAVHECIVEYGWKLATV